MNPEEIFHAALAKPPTERSSFLAGACPNDERLRRRVEALLQAHENPGSFLADRSPMVGVTIDEPIRERPGTVIGPYKLLEQIGEGGFGVVFMAEQTEPVRRKVALKILKPGMDTRQVVARFEAERQALAIMDHPNIARVIDGGATASGRPYFVMELVKGVPITEYCDQNQLTPRQRLELFVTICQAVQHAHQKGIIHRDLKPTNVLVTVHDTTPVVKVIDFGVAKALGQELTDKTLFTGFGQMIGTPLYMSPEQAGQSGLDSDTRSDIYSLGVLLYELLTGTTPFDKARFKQAAHEEIRRIIREEEPPKPSTRLSDSGEALVSISAKRHMEPAKLTKLVRGELDWIVMKTLEKDRNRRYETAKDFAADVQRYLNDEAVEASPPSAAYRLRKFARRNRKVLATATAFVLLLLLGVVGLALALWAVNLERENTQAALEQVSEEQGRTKGALDQMTEARKRTRQALARVSDQVIEESIGSKAQLTEKEKEFLRQILRSYEEFAAEQGETPEAREARAEGYHRIGLLRSKFGELKDAESAYRRAVDIREKLAADFPTVPQYRQDLGHSHNDLGLLLGTLRRGPAVEQAFRRALDIREKLAADYPTVPQYRLELAVSQRSLASEFSQLRQWPEAEQACRKALSIQEKLAAELPTVPAEYRMELAVSYDVLGFVLWQFGDTRPAGNQAWNWALDIREKLAADFPTVVRYRTDLARSYHLLGSRLGFMGQPAQAESVQAIRKAIDAQAKLAADFPTVPQYRGDLAGSYNVLAVLLELQGQRPAAEQPHRNAIAIWEKLAAEFPSVPGYRQELARNQNNLGDLLAKLGQWPAAEEQSRKSLDIREKLTADFPTEARYRWELADSCVSFGNLVRDQREAGASLAWYAKAIALLQPLAQREPHGVGVGRILRDAHRYRAEALDKLNRHADADKDWDQALALAGNLEGKRYMLCNRLMSLARTGEHAKAVVEANALAEAKDVPNWTLYALACVYGLAAAAKDDAKLQDKYAVRAVELLRQALAKGYRDIDRLKRDEDLKVLRQREDFKKLLAGLEKK